MKRTEVVALKFYNELDKV